MIDSNTALKAMGITDNDQIKANIDMKNGVDFLGVDIVDDLRTNVTISFYMSSEENDTGITEVNLSDIAYITYYKAN